MKEINILPADTFVVVNRTILNESDRKIISMLYQPIIGSMAVSLYYTLWADLDKTELLSGEYTHHHLMTSLRIKMDSIVTARKKLEAVGLLKTFVKKGNVNSYVYEMFSPISASEFFNHPVLNIVLYNNIGKKEYENLLKYFKVPRINLSTYEELTCSFDEVFESSPLSSYDNLNEDLRVNKTGEIKIDKGFDFDLLFSSVPDGIITNKTFSKEVKELINNLSFVYDLDALEMKGPILNSIKENGLIDKTLLRKSVRNYYKYKNDNKLPSLVYKIQPEYLRNPVGADDKRAKMIYVFENTSPYKFLKGRSNGAQPSARDLNVLESLLNDFKLNPGVVNVLVDYVLKINNKKLTRSYLETIASQWKRLNIETVEEAMKAAEKEYKRTKTSQEIKSSIKNIKDEKLPDWFNQSIKKEKISEEDEKSLKEMLKEFS
ncbi:MAG: replication initiation and membrane attachment family protein [Candidatus Aphodocola sp.]